MTTDFNDVVKCLVSRIDNFTFLVKIVRIFLVACYELTILSCPIQQLSISSQYSCVLLKFQHKLLKNEAKTGWIFSGRSRPHNFILSPEHNFSKTTQNHEVFHFIHFSKKKYNMAIYKRSLSKQMLHVETAWFKEYHLGK